MRLSALLIAILGLVARHGAAQNATCQPGFDWSFNSLGQSPCVIAAILAGSCTNEPFTVPPLSPGFMYFGPPTSSTTSCRCSSVFYSLLSACAVCQLDGFITWTQFKSNCTVVYSQVFLQPIPSDTRVPHYAYLDVTAGDNFNPTLAKAAVGAESTTLPSQTGTGPLIPTTPASGGKKSHTGAIAGGVVGGILGLCVIVGSIFWFIRRKNQRDMAPADIDPVAISQNITEPATFSSTTPLRLYDPNDPSTYPTNGLHSNTQMAYNPYNPNQPSPQILSTGISHPGIPEV